MARYTPSGQVTTIPQNQAEFEKIQTAIDDTLSRKGDTPNGMEADLDMNSNRILNLPAPSALTEPLRLSDLDSFLGGNLSIDLSSVTKVIDNVDTMKGDSTLNSGDVVLCKKYYSGGDLVEGLIYEFQSSGTADGYIDHAAANGIAKLITTGEINVKQAGAKGDGIQNDQPFIQACIDRVKGTSGTTSGIVFMPAGIYRTDSEILLDGSVKLYGERLGTVLQPNSETFSVIRIEAASDFIMSYWEISDLYIRYASQASDSRAIGIQLDDSGGSNRFPYSGAIKNVRIQNPYIGFKDDTVAFDIILEQVAVYTPYQSAFLCNKTASTMYTFINCAAFTSTANSHSFNLTGLRYLKMVGCAVDGLIGSNSALRLVSCNGVIETLDIEQCYTDSSTGLITLSGCNININGCRFDDNSLSANDSGVIYTTSNTKLLLNSTVVANTATTATGRSSALSVSGSTDSVILMNNTLEAPTGTGTPKEVVDFGFKTTELGADGLSLAGGETVQKSGAGTPEGSVTAKVGSLFVRTDGGAGSTLYVKESGTGNTGWVAK